MIEIILYIFFPASWLSCIYFASLAPFQPSARVSYIVWFRRTLSFILARLKLKLYIGFVWERRRVPVFLLLWTQREPQEVQSLSFFKTCTWTFVHFWPVLSEFQTFIITWTSAKKQVRVYVLFTDAVDVSVSRSQKTTLKRFQRNVWSTEHRQQKQLDATTACRSRGRNNRTSWCNHVQYGVPECPKQYHQSRRNGSILTPCFLENKMTISFFNLQKTARRKLISCNM